MIEPGKPFHFPPLRGCPELVLIDHIPQGDYANRKMHTLIQTPYTCMDCGGKHVVFRGLYEKYWIYTCCSWRCLSIYSCISR